jgi:hypothetical protein
MKIVNRGFITVTPKQVFKEWANSVSNEVEWQIEDYIEPNVYLITEDFLEVEPIIEQHFKKIFENELSMVTEDETVWPSDCSISVFLSFFHLEIGSTVLDLEKSDLRGSKI